MSGTSGDVFSESSLRGVLSALSIPIFSLDLDGRIASWNGRSGEFGYSDSEIEGKLFVDFVDGRSKTDVGRLIAQACKGSDQASLALLVAKDGKCLEVFFNATPWREEGGVVRGCVLFGHFVAEQASSSMHPFYQDPLERVFETAGMPVFCIDKGGCVTIWNRKLAELTGYSREHAQGQALVKSFVAKESAGDIQKLLGNSLDKCTLKIALLTKSGERVDRLFAVTVMRDAAGNVCGALGLGYEVTEPDVAAKGTAIISEDLARVMDTASAMVFGIDKDGRVTEWNQKIASISGCERQHALGMPFVETFVSPGHHKEAETALNMVLLGYDTTECVFHLVRKDGQKCEALVSTSVRRGAAGQITGIIAVGQDVTQLIRNNEDHRCFAEEWEQFIETANAPLFGVDLEGNVNEWNTKIASITGYSREEALDRPFVQDFIPEVHHARVQEVLSETGSGWERANFEVPLQTKHGVHIDVAINTTTRKNGAGEIVGVFGLGNDITSLKDAVRKMTREAYNLSRLIETANALIFGVDLSGKVDEWNTKTADLTGYSKEEALGRPLVRDFISAEHRSAVDQLLTDARNGKEAANFELSLATKSGKHIQILLNVTIRHDESGAVIGVLGVGQDITEFRVDLTGRSSIVDDLARFIDTANAPIFGIDKNGRVTEWNQKAAAISGYGKAECIGKVFVDTFLSDQFKKEVGDVLSKALCGGDTTNLTFPLFTKDGYRREISLNATARRGANGDITGVIGVGQDVTELNQISAQNHRMASDWQRLIETANAPIFGVDIYGNVNEWNAKVAEVTGYLKTEVVRRPLVQNFIARDHQDRVQNVLTAARNGRETANFEFPLATRTGKQIDILFNATPRRDEKGVVVGVFGVGQDITNLRSALTESKCIADDLTRLIDTANAPIFGIDTKGLVNEWNSKATEISGWGKKEAFGKVFVNTFISEDFRSQVSEVLTRALAGSDTANFTFPLFAKEGRRREISLNATARRGADGEIIGVIGDRTSQITSRAV
ncbi:unnamed protein product [Prorocentrum cordatum]|uniref:PAS domain S-box protein n=1 Tax=Prorocentrum cordatum TaxID=2364126 RepID=A0ABN9SWZ1_9DINO|nr:unnamed protein product [Polarella glacialis]